VALARLVVSGLGLHVVLHVGPWSDRDAMVSQSTAIPEGRLMKELLGFALEVWVMMLVIWSPFIVTGLGIWWFSR
jgi:hypothetical protein